MQKVNKLNYDFLNCAKYMPPLKHTKSIPFDIRKSDVAKFLMTQPDIMQKIFDMACRKGVIEYNPDTQTWQGVNYKDD